MFQFEGANKAGTTMDGMGHVNYIIDSWLFIKKYFHAHLSILYSFTYVDLDLQKLSEWIQIISFI